MDLHNPDALLVVPPLAHLTWPSLAAHQLAACAHEAGIAVEVLYASAAYACMVGPARYAALCNAPAQWLLGDRLFARAAHGLPPLGHQAEELLALVDRLSLGAEASGNRYLDDLSASSGVVSRDSAHVLTRQDLLQCEAAALELAERVADRIARAKVPVVGATTTFDQTCAAVAILARVKRARPRTLTLLGGANAHGDMAHGLRSVAPSVDCVVSGEGEGAFVEILRQWRDTGQPPPPVVRGRPVEDLDDLPPPSYRSFFEQVPPGLGDAPLWVLFETSRGCGWADRERCTFCGLNPHGSRYRRHSPDGAIQALGQVLAGSPTRRVCMTDNTMPRSYLRSLVPRLARELPELHVFYEVRPDLRAAELEELVLAGVHSVQPGIEALDSELLRLMNKGVQARHTLRLLVDARSVGMRLRWNLLYGIPGDSAYSYGATLAMLPLLRHLQPPQALAPVHLERFSTYAEEPERYGISDLRPLSAYRAAFPEGADLERLAYHFEGEYPSGSLEAPELLERLRAAVEDWNQAWQGPTAPTLRVRRIADDIWQLVDTRGLGGPASLYLSEAQARAVLVESALEADQSRWALSRGYAVALDGRCVPLATTPTGAMQQLLGEVE